IALETGVKVDDITRLLDQLGLKFVQTATLNAPTPAELKARGVFDVPGVSAGPGGQAQYGYNSMPTAPTPQKTGASRAFAGGDVRNAHSAEMAPGGAWRLWAEPETGGESYIPHANDWRRPRAVALWEQTGRILGQFAAGGVNISAMKPKASD